MNGESTRPISPGNFGEKSWDTETETFFFVSTEKADRYRQARERYYENKARSRAIKRSDRPSFIPLNSRPFIIWDGEGPRDTGYSLFGNSKGMEICHPWLESEECLKLIIDTGAEYPSHNHVGFGFNYDVTMIIRNLPARHKNMLYKFKRTRWKGYHLEHIPRKWFKVSYGNVSVKIFDVHSFFTSSLVVALEKWNIGPFGPLAPDDDESRMVKEFKAKRAEFLWEEIESIAAYMRLELKYTEQLMLKLRDMCATVGYIPTSWHGPGALARMAFKKHGVYACMAVCPDAVREAARYAYYGGRFELFKAGHLKHPVYVYDINSAYPYYASMLPNLARGEWRKTHVFEPEKFGVYHVRYDSGYSRNDRIPGTQAGKRAYSAHPIPFRSNSGNVTWPDKVETWVWNPEAELVKDSVIEGWIFDETDINDRPFRWIPEYYAKRKEMKAAGDPAEYTLKLIINSIYGQLAQRAGWDQKENTAPKTHQLEWAGWITSSCRAAIYKAAMEAGDNIVSIDTDGICSLGPIRNLDLGKELGQWEYDKYEDAIFWQSGIYALKDNSGWSKARTRGIPKGSYSPEQLLETYNSGGTIKQLKKTFITYNLALLRPGLKECEWIEETNEIEFGGGPGSKRRHILRASKRPDARGCTKACNDISFHRLGLSILRGPFDEIPHSKPHYIPWENPEDKLENQDLFDDMTIVLKGLGEEIEWL